MGGGWWSEPPGSNTMNPWSSQSFVIMLLWGRPKYVYQIADHNFSYYIETSELSFLINMDLGMPHGICVCILYIVYVFIHWNIHTTQAQTLIISRFFLFGSHSSLIWIFLAMWLYQVRLLFYTLIKFQTEKITVNISQRMNHNNYKCMASCSQQ